jgi:hypothetical protein
MAKEHLSPRLSPIWKQGKYQGNHARRLAGNVHTRLILAHFFCVKPKIIKAWRSLSVLLAHLPESNAIVCGHEAQDQA